MARRSGIFITIVREAARAQKRTESEKRRQLQVQKRERKETERRIRRAQLTTERESRQLERESRQQYLEDRASEVIERNEELRKQIEELQEILEHTLSVDDTIAFNDLRIKEKHLPFRPPAAIAAAKPPPQKEDFFSTVKTPSKASQLLPWIKARYHRELAAADVAYEAAVKSHKEMKSQREAQLAQLQVEHERTKQAFLQKVQQRHQEVDELEKAYKNGDPDAIVTYSTMVLERSEYPEGFPQQFQIAYVPESKQLVIEYELPSPNIVPNIAEFRYVKARDSIDEKLRKASETKEIYQDVIAAVTLRTIHEILEADQGNHIQVVVFSGLVHTIDLATGKDIRPHLISVRTTKTSFHDLNLARVDKRVCLRNLGAQVSPQPAELVPVRPIVDFNMVDKRFIEGNVIIDNLDGRPNLMDLSPYEFEQLVRDLFAKNGLETKLTRSSRDGGVDVVAFDNRPVLGGKVVIQAKRYRNTVGVSAVRDLYGTMMNEGANKGILVTTSGYGTDAFNFAKDKPIELIDGGGLLYLLEQVEVKARIILPEE